MSEDLEKEFQLQSGGRNFKKFLDSLHALDNADKAFAVPAIADVSQAFGDLLSCHSGLDYEDIEPCCSALTLSLINACSYSSAYPIYDTEDIA